jgi:transcriptional regulator with GAF, ATPase, and Fis domain
MEEPRSRNRFATEVGLFSQNTPALSSLFDAKDGLSVEEAGEVFKETFSHVGRSMGIDRWVVTVLDGDGRKVDPLVWYDIDSVDPLIAQWFDRDPSIADRVRKWFTRSKEGEVQRWHLPAEVQGTKGEMIDVFRKAGIKSGVSVPLAFRGPFSATFSAFTTHAYRTWPDEWIPFFRFFGESFMAMLRCTHLAETLSNKRLIKKTGQWTSGGDLVCPNVRPCGSTPIIGNSDALRTVLTKIAQVASNNVGVLLLGETGVGKGVFARAIHDASPRRDLPFVHVNCAALASNLIESELFGHEKGTFTGAANRRLGRFEIADESTLFLDEIGELPLELQSKLLRVLDHGEFERLGSNRTIRTDVRIIAATNRNLSREVEAGRFRHDLWYRLSVFPILIPPLRERQSDIEPLVRHFIQSQENRWGRAFDPVPSHIMTKLSRYPWPGNVRELENVVTRAAITGAGGQLDIEIPHRESVYPSGLAITLKEAEREHIRAALEKADWRIQGPRGAAERLDLPPSTLRSRMKSLHIVRPAS